MRIGLSAVVVLCAVLSGRLVQLQGVDGTAYAAQAERQRLRAVVLGAERGAILDRGGGVLARSVEARAIYGDPTMVAAPRATARTLSPLIGVPTSTLVARLTRKGRFVYLRRGLSPAVASAVLALNLPGIGALDEARREDPGHDLAANVIGFTGSDGQGLAGIESEYDAVLRGRDGKHEFEVARSGQQLPGGVNDLTPAVPGRSVVLTIDRDVQYVAQQLLVERMKGVGAYSGSAIVLDSRTGQVLAMASAPTYDASRPNAYPSSAYVNWAVSTVVEPGSVHKAVTIGAALQDGVIDPTTTMVVPPTIRKGGKTFADTHKHGVVRLTLMGILAQSSNVGTIEIADRLGPQRLYDFQRRFGLGSKTGVGFPGESAGILQRPQDWSRPAHGGIPIGLGVAVTPIQMACVYATIANNGRWVQPSLVRGFVPDGGGFVPAARPRTVRVMAPKLAAVLRTDLSAIATAEGTGHRAAIPGYVIAGKTGTGQRTQNGHYLAGNVASFIGMAPAAAPRYVVAVFVHAPTGVGGAVSAPVFRDLMSFTLRHYKVPPIGSLPALRFLAD